MRIFASPEVFAAELAGTKKWDRTLEAVANARHVLPEVTYSIGDSLTYRVTTSPSDAVLSAHRRYLTVRHVLEGETVVEVAAVESLAPTDDYDDLTDRRHYEGSGEVVTLGPGSVLVAGIDEALRDVDVQGRILTLRVTVEGAFFANK